MIQSENFEFPEPISDLNVVIGAGPMGHSIAGVFAGGGASVTVHDVDPRALEAVPEKLGKQLVTVGADPAAANRVRLAATLEAVAPGVHLVIEAVAEVLDVKQELFARLGTLFPHAVLATNTSVFKIGEVARHSSHPERVPGTHWWNPPHLIPLVEVVHGDSTNPAVADSVAHSKAPPVVTALIEAGHLGAKTGSGLLHWDSSARAAAAERLEQHLLKPVSGPS